MKYAYEVRTTSDTDEYPQSVGIYSTLEEARSEFIKAKKHKASVVDSDEHEIYEVWERKVDTWSLTFARKVFSAIATYNYEKKEWDWNEV